jgi:hypothetical protein
MVESIQRVLKRRAPAGQQPSTPQEIIAWFATVAGHWNKGPTPFERGGKRKRGRDRDRQRERRHRLGGSGGFIRKPVRRRSSRGYGHTQGKLPTSLQTLQGLEHWRTLARERKQTD